MDTNKSLKSIFLLTLFATSLFAGDTCSKAEIATNPTRSRVDWEARTASTAGRIEEIHAQHPSNDYATIDHRGIAEEAVRSVRKFDPLIVRVGVIDMQNNLLHSNFHAIRRYASLIARIQKYSSPILTDEYRVSMTSSSTGTETVYSPHADFRLVFNVKDNKRTVTVSFPLHYKVNSKSGEERLIPKNWVDFLSDKRKISACYADEIHTGHIAKRLVTIDVETENLVYFEELLHIPVLSVKK